MLYLGNVFLDSMPHLVAAVTDQDQNSALVDSYADIFEIRIDMFSNLDPAHIIQQVARIRTAGRPVILTIRNDVKEGGFSDMTDEFKYNIFESAMSFADAVDIELLSSVLTRVIALAKLKKKLVFVSLHDFNQTVSDEELEDYFQRAKTAGADIVKLAMKANGMDDVFRFMAFSFKHRAENIVTMSLGSLGVLSRLTFPFAGSLLTYSFISQASAPGQVPLDRLQRDLRFYYPEYDKYFIERNGLV